MNTSVKTAPFLTLPVEALLFTEMAPCWYWNGTKWSNIITRRAAIFWVSAMCQSWFQEPYVCHWHLIFPTFRTDRIAVVPIIQIKGGTGGEVSGQFGVRIWSPVLHPCTYYSCFIPWFQAWYPVDFYRLSLWNEPWVGRTERFPNLPQPFYLYVLGRVLDAEQVASSGIIKTHLCKRPWLSGLALGLNTLDASWLED